LEALKVQENIGMVTLNNDSLQVTDIGWFFVRAVAMLFDRYLQTDRNRARFSKII
jgi:oxygen-independent coproporphyrinogen-3 oxidase